jgi:hypothetical protein
VFPRRDLRSTMALNENNNQDRSSHIEPDDLNQMLCINQERGDDIGASGDIQMV